MTSRMLSGLVPTPSLGSLPMGPAANAPSCSDRRPEQLVTVKTSSDGEIDEMDACIRVARLCRFGVYLAEKQAIPGLSVALCI